MKKNEKKGFDYESCPQGLDDNVDGKNINFIFLREQIDRKLKEKKHISLLEIGCGGGRNLKALHRMYGKRVDLAGVDVSQKAIDYAKQFNIGNFRKVSAGRIMENKKYDLVMVIDLLEHLGSIKEVEETLVNARRLLKKEEGLLYISVPIEKNLFSMTWLYSFLPYCRDWTKEFYGHLLQFQNQEMVKLVRKLNYQVIEEFYSVHWLAQIQTLLFYFMPKFFLHVFFSQKVNQQMRDANQALNGRGPLLLQFSKKLVVNTGRIFSFISSRESSIRRNSPLGAGNLHLLLKSSK